MRPRRRYAPGVVRLRPGHRQAHHHLRSPGQDWRISQRRYRGAFERERPIRPTPATARCMLPSADPADLQILLPAGTVPGANGIALSDDEKTLFVAGDFGITRVDLKTKSAALLSDAARRSSTPASMACTSTGIRWWEFRTESIREEWCAFTLTRADKITHGEILETYNPAVRDSHYRLPRWRLTVCSWPTLNSTNGRRESRCRPRVNCMTSGFCASRWTSTEWSDAELGSKRRTMA